MSSKYAPIAHIIQLRDRLDNALTKRKKAVFGQLDGFFRSLTDLDFADDVALLDTTGDGLQDMIHHACKTSKRIELTRNSSKTKVLAVNQSTPLDDKLIENIDEFKYKCLF